MDDPKSKALRERLDALLRRAREISEDIERRVEKVTSEPAPAPPAVTQAALEVAADAVAVSAEAAAVSAQAAAVTAEALSTIARETEGGPPSPDKPPDPSDKSGS